MGKKTEEPSTGTKTLQKKSRSIGTPYDDAFRTLSIDCPQLLIPVINEVFGKSYTGKEQIVRHPNEHFINDPDGTYEKRITDSDFSIFGIRNDLGVNQNDINHSDNIKATDNSNTADELDVRDMIDAHEEIWIQEDRYLFECQSTDDHTMIIRIVEYSFHSAMDEGEVNQNNLTLNIPNAAVLFLRSSGTTPNFWNVNIKTPGGEVSYQIPTLKMVDYSLEDIFAKKLYFLLPFYIFIREDWIKVAEEDVEKRNQLLAELKNMADTLETLMEEKNVTAYEYTVIMEMAKVVSDALIGNRETIREGVDQIMGGKVLNHRAKDIYRAAVEDQRAKDARAMFDDGLEPERIARILKLDLADVEVMLGLRKMA